MRPGEFFDVAEALRALTTAPTEGCGRSAVSRYYYAAFLDARDRLRERRGLTFKSNEAHENVKKAYYWADPKPVKKVGRLLEELKKLRIMADYDLESSHDSVSVEEAQALSREICSDLAEPGFDYAACVDPSRRGN
jgi:hypothetical protein